MIEDGKNAKMEILEGRAGGGTKSRTSFLVLEIKFQPRDLETGEGWGGGQETIGGKIKGV